ncbi:MAG: MFS transporter [Anaerolineae bacterium]|nr:MFS transporter [Anaerolineae bacterium]
MNNIEKLSRKITFGLFLSQSLFSAGLIIIFTVGSIVMVELAGGNTQWSGVPTMLVLVGAGGMAYPIGRFMDRHGRRPGLSIGFALGVVGALLAGWAVIIGSIWLFLAGVLLIGMNRGANDLGRYAAAEASPANKRARALSTVVWGGTVGSLSGPLTFWAVGVVSERLDLSENVVPWFAGGIFLGLALLVLNIFLRPDPQTIAQHFDAEEAVTRPVDGPARTIREIFAQPYAKIAAGALLAGQLTMVTVMTVTPVHMHALQYNFDAISWVIMFHTLGMFGLSFVTGWLVDRLGQLRMILIGGFVLVASCLLAPLWGTVPMLALSLFLLGLGWNFCFVAGSAMLTTVITTTEKGSIQGFTDALVYAASGVGSIGSGFVFTALGFLVMSWLSIIVALLPVVLVVLLATPRQAPALGGTVSK